MISEAEEQTNLKEEDLDLLEDIEMQEVELLMMIEIYGEKWLTNLSKEEIQLLQKELRNVKYKSNLNTQNLGQPTCLGIQTN